MRRSWTTFAFLTGVLLVGSAAGTDPVVGRPGPAAAFDAANKLYEEGHYLAAVAGYRKIQEQGLNSAALYFNLGNAYFKSGEAGQAIVNYRLAQSVAPRDPDIRANLRFTRKSVGGDALESFGQRWVLILTPNELTALAATLLWSWIAILCLRQLRPGLASSLRPIQWWFGVALALCAIWLGLVIDERLGKTCAVVAVPEASVRYGPLDESQSFFTVRNGAELKVMGRKDHWLQVTDQAHHVGWLRDNAVVVLPRGA